MRAGQGEEENNMKNHIRVMSLGLALLLLCLSLISCGESCGKTDDRIFVIDDPANIAVLREKLASPASYTLTYLLVGVEAEGLRDYNVVRNGGNIVYRDTPFSESYEVIEDTRVVVYQRVDDTFVPYNTYLPSEYEDIYAKGDKESLENVRGYLDAKYWAWSDERCAFLATDLTVFSALGIEVSEMELSLAVKSCELTGKGVITYGGERYDVNVTLAVTDIGATRITLPSGISASAEA